MTTSKKSKVGLRNWVLFGILLVSTSLTVLLWLPKRPPTPKFGLFFDGHIEKRRTWGSLSQLELWR